MSVPVDSLGELNSEFGIPGALLFEIGAGGFVFAKITTEAATAEVCLYGAHVTSFVPHGAEELLWLSDEAVYRDGKAIRGGVPICWPWFSAHPTDPEKPSHGFARISEWEVVGSLLTEAGEVRLELVLPGEVEGRVTVVVGKRLEVGLRTTNRGDSVFPLTEALHSYLRVADVREVRVDGLDGVSYLDDVRGSVEMVQDGDVVIGGEVDRRYEHSAGELLVRDVVGERTLKVTKSGSATTIVWNPWSNRAAEIGDMPDDGYLTMLCVEAGNAGAGVVELAPGESHVLETAIWVC